MATTREVAALAGVSLGTASRALSGRGSVAEETRQQVLAAAEKLGYEYRRHEIPKQMAVGIVVPDLSLPYFSSFLKYAELELGLHGFTTSVCSTLGVQGRLSEMISQVEKHRLDGLIVNCDATAREITRMAKLPVVSLESMLSSDIPMVSPDHCQGGQLAAQRLLDHNCQHVIIMAAVQQTRRYADLRVEKCCSMLRSQGVQVTVAEYNGTMLSFAYVREMSRQYMNIYKNADGIFTDDLSAYCCVAEALRQGKAIPEELTVLGFDGHDISRMVSPRITTIACSMPDLSSACVKLLMERIEGIRTKGNFYLPVSIIEGGTA